MLRKIMFSNIFSFEETQLVDFEGKDMLYAIYGKNSAGKSNVLMIINLLYSTMYKKLEDLEGIGEYSCKFNDDPIINIAAKLTISNKDYFYSVSINTEELKYKKQELIKIEKSGEPITIFNLDSKGFSSDILSKTEKSAIKTFNIEMNGVFPYVEDIKESENFNDIILLHKYSNFEKSTNQSIKYLYENKEVVDSIVQELRKIDVDIDGLDFIDRRKMKMNLLDDIEKSGQNENENILKFISGLPDFELETIHNEKKFGMNLESSGTRRYLDLLISYFVEDISNTDVPRIIDELETHLHNDLYKKFIEFYKENSKRQLVFTTHNQELLENKLLDKNNIIIVDKKNNKSQITLLSEYKNLRSDDRHNWKKMYNKFMFGGKPNVI